MLNFRRGTDIDIEGIEKLEQENFSDAWTRRGISDTLEQKQAFVIVAEEDTNVLGYCIVYYVMDEAEIARIAVQQNARRRGIGKGLLDFVSQCCEEYGVERLLLDVREGNDGAIRFYEAYGFGVDGIRKNFYESPKEHAVLMSKALTTFSTMMGERKGI